MPVRTPRRQRKTAASSPQDDRASAPRPARRKGRGWFARLFKLGLWLTVLGGAALIVLNLIYSSIARRYDLADLGKLPERSIVYDRNGQELGRIHGENRIVVKLADVAPCFIDALLAREDDRFRSHGGVDWSGVLRALVRNVRDGTQQGASTITMQLARTSYKLPVEKSLHRKLLEIAITRRIEEHCSKDRILELYVNRIFFGTGIHGIERAAQCYFGKKARDLKLDEAAMLAAIIRGPNVFSPFRHYETAMSGRDMVLDRMVATGRLTAAEAGKAKLVRTRVQAPPAPLPDNWVLDAVRRELDRLLANEDVEAGGMLIRTSIDTPLQAETERTLERQLSEVERMPGYEHQTRAQYLAQLAKGGAGEPEYLQGAVIVIENETGAIRAVAGGRDVNHTIFNRALQAKRQAGSTFKPFVYAAAVERGLNPGTPLNDGPLQPGEIPGAPKDFQPKNSDSTFRGMQPAEWGLIASRNTMTVRAGEFAGMDAVLDLAARSGLRGIEGRSPQIYIGNAGLTLEALTSAMSIFPSGGMRCRPFLIESISDMSGAEVFRSGVISYEAVNPAAARTVRGMLQRVMEPGGTAEDIRKLGFRGLAGGKTGTTDDFHDAWFVGFTPRLSCGVWVGLDDPGRIVQRGYGNKIALPVWAGVMRAAGDGGSSWFR